MNWTIGYITDSDSDLLRLATESVRREAPDAQLIIVGGKGLVDCDLHIPFDESQKPRWITRKKNLIAQHAEHDKVCILHDYIALEPGWLQGNEEFGYDWLTCMHRVLNQNGQRYRDWCVIHHNGYIEPPIDNTPLPDGPGRMMHYSTRGYERWQYYSGSYFCTKRDVILKVPLDEQLVAGGGEDVAWSRRLYEKYGPSVFTMNPNASVKLLKYKNPVPWQLEPCL